ncbi:hypothetical protein CaCOL14_012346 [Colletotrichum acutatum]|uniref:Ankyrin repeat-containing domain protein n=1 Tax=Glomerella acutata TaxID=27357 RepID=A0AAD8U521_GLOAC|nr:ankyrin repeat-containing domain protein [Colletotrichum acutatum]KAK1705025.1 ankyrin repeat-containing domain protein [Colletotrichum acutatum]
MEAETRRGLRAWLGCPPPTDLFHEARQKRLERTCDWVLNRHEFIEWLAPNREPVSTESFLWINGPAGLGKTVLCARIVEHLLSTSQTPVAYFFLSSDFESRNDPYAAVRSWIHQLTSCNQVAYHLARDKWLAQNEDFATQIEIVDLFREVVQVVPGAYFVLDGLDECTWMGKGQGDGKSLQVFLNSITRAVANTDAHILVVSRDEPEIRSDLMYMKEWGELKIVRGDVQSDVARYARSIVDKKLFKKYNATREEVSRMLADRSQGQFLWVKLHEDSLRSWKNNKQLEDAIEEIPSGLDHVYERNWVRISRLPEPIRDRAYSLLQWAAFSIRPLTVNEISEATLLKEDDDGEFPASELPEEIDEDYIESEIQSPCGSLLEIRGTHSDSELGQRTVHLTHFSVKQYFLRNTIISTQWPLCKKNRQLSNTILQSSRLAKLCLRYIHSEHFRYNKETADTIAGSNEGENIQVSVKRSFRHYATVSWYQHAAAGNEDDFDLHMLIKALFDERSPSWVAWRDMFQMYSTGINWAIITSIRPHDASPIHYAARFGLTRITSYLIHDRKYPVNAKTPFGRTALEIAGTAGNLRVAKVLLDAGADTSIRNENGSTPLIEVALQGVLSVAELLLENGADISAANDEGFTSLASACIREHVPVVKLLLEKGANTSVADKDGWTPLSSAALYGHQEIVRLLLENGSDVSDSSNGSWTPLTAACSQGHLEVVKLLLEKGADIAHPYRDMRSPLHWASVRGFNKVAEMLLEKGADITATTDQGWTPLHLAASSGHLKTVKLLLEHGADTNRMDTSGWKPLYLASSKGHSKVVKLLLKYVHGSGDIDRPGLASLDPTTAAKELELSQLLLTEPLAERQYLADATGWTPLHEASYTGRIKVVRLLLDLGADRWLVDARGWTVLHAAAVGGHAAVTKLLLKDPDCKASRTDDMRRTPLFHAATHGFDDVAKLLTFQNQGDIHITDKYGSTPLSAACRNGHSSVVKHLLSLDKSTIGIRDILGRDSIWWARNGGDTKVIRLVVQHASRLGLDTTENNVLGTHAADFAEDSVMCDMCVTCVPDHIDVWGCNLCNGGDFDICLECRSLGLRCQDEHDVWFLKDPRT